MNRKVLGKRQIKTWKQFSYKVRKKGYNLLSNLDRFPNSVLVTGCQRSGTTMLSRIITQSIGMKNYWFGKDDELDAALILSGIVNLPPEGRYCFQTTYLNERYIEYFNHKNGSHKLIWVLRNPYSVVYSFLYNWERFALNELFDYCGSELLKGEERLLYYRFGRFAVKRAKRACLAFNGKILQLPKIVQEFGEERIKIVEYEELVKKPADSLKEIYSFIDLEFDKNYAKMIHAKSLVKKRNLPEKIKLLVNKMCEPLYADTRKLIK
jgi:hypothetical protein